MTTLSFTNYPNGSLVLVVPAAAVLALEPAPYRATCDFARLLVRRVTDTSGPEFYLCDFSLPDGTPCAQLAAYGGVLYDLPPYLQHLLRGSAQYEEAAGFGLEITLG